MLVSNLKVFSIGIAFGILILFISIWLLKENIIKHIMTSSFMGSNLKNELVIIKKDVTLYQGDKEIGILKKGTILEYVQHVDKIDHYKLNINFEAGMYNNSNSIIESTTGINQFTTADLVVEN